MVRDVNYAAEGKQLELKWAIATWKCYYADTIKHIMPKRR